MVLLKKWVAIAKEVIKRYSNFYQDNFSIIEVTNMSGKTVRNSRLSLHQGDIPSMFFFAFGIDPLIVYLEKKQPSFMISSLPLLGPAHHVLSAPEECYNVVSYAYDLKSAITTMHELITF